MTLKSDRYWRALLADIRRRSRLKRATLMTRDVIRRRRVMS